MTDFPWLEWVVGDRRPASICKGYSRFRHQSFKFAPDPFVTVEETKSPEVSGRSLLNVGYGSTNKENLIARPRRTRDTAATR